MTINMAERHRLAVLGWLATVATSLSLYPALHEKRFVVIGAGVSAVAVAVGMLWRHLRLPTALAPVVQLLVAAELLLWGYGGHLAYGLLPTSTTFSTVHHRISAGMDMAQRYAAPVPHSPGLTLMIVAFVTAVAVAVDLIAAGLMRAPLAGLPLLTLYSVPVASLPHGVPILGFIPGAAVYLALLMVAERERLGHWGRHVARSASADPASRELDTSAMAAVGRRISVAAIAVAVVVPMLVPGFSHQLFRGSGGLGNGDGSTLAFDNPMVSLASSLHLKQPVDLLDVDSATPPAYLRLAVLDRPGPNAWTSTGVNASATVPSTELFPPPAGLGDNVQIVDRTMGVRLDDAFPDDSGWLPVPFGATAVSLVLSGGLSDDWAFVPADETMAATIKGAAGHVDQYTVSYGQIQPTESELERAAPPPPQIVAAYGGVPARVPAVVGEVARDVTADATNDYQRALDLQGFFRDSHQFTYDLNAGYGYGYRAMARFLQARRGYCQHFAATMAMMARTLGIPSRVVVGFLAPTGRSSNGSYVFTSHDAHAWPELYFSGVGWVRFEPTPGNGAVIPPYTHNVSVPTVNPRPNTQGNGAIIGHRATDFPTTSAPAPRHHAAAAAAATGGVPPLTWLVVLVVLAALLTPAAVRVGVRRARLSRAVDGGPSCEHAWKELRDRIVDLRLPWTGSLTPRARQRFVEPLLGGDPEAVAALDQLIVCVERARYASSGLRGARPGDEAATVMAAVAREAGRKRRAIAFLWPASLMPQLHGGRSAARRWLRRLRAAEVQS